MVKQMILLLIIFVVPPSLNGGSPLVVIDGVVSTSDQLNRMNPVDIANISVLKDAASSAIYGSRAAFGVILVTTKDGSNEKLYRQL